ncbi:hypothetical protein [Bdellovibrio sp. HCB-162]|uniref:hypothetical protein n=1 Tax=Bdellovibrio sp. HCB-162 TaxID=3394234 RepID=UPI0039BD6DD8
MKFKVSDLSVAELRKMALLEFLRAIGFQVLIVFPIIFILEYINLDKMKIENLPILFSYFSEFFGWTLLALMIGIGVAVYKMFKQLAYTAVDISGGELFLSRSKTSKKYLGKSFRKIVVVSPPWFMRFYFDGALYKHIILLRKGLHFFSLPIIVRLEKDDLAQDFAKEVGESLGVAVYLQCWHGIDKKIS